MISICCRAVATQTPILVQDIAADPRWAGFADFVGPYGLRAGWSTPIIGSEGKILGTFANYYRQPCDPTPSDLHWLDIVKRTAAIAIERRQAEKALRAGEEQLRQLNQDLKRRVEQEVAEREAAQLQLAHAQRMEALGQLAGGIAHDFNNVLQAIQGGGALIERRPADPEGVRRLARLITDAAGRGAGVTRRLLAFARRDHLRAEPVNPAELLTDMHEILAHTLGAGIEVRLKVAPHLPMLMADRGQLETVLVNLATNGRDAMPEGGTLTLAAYAETVGHDQATQRAQLAPGAYVRMAVTDTGLGMDDATLAHAAEPFFTTKPVGQGTGLGLAMASGFAAQSGGGFDIRSKPGQGTTISLWFPVAEAGIAAEAVGEDSPLADGGNRARLLLVDDDAIVLETIAEQMEAAGYGVLTAPSGQAALALLESGEAVDLIVSDLSMPGMGGIALIQQAQRQRSGLPAILLTGFAGNAAEIAIGGAVSGTFSLLRKPIDGTQLAERVAALLETSKSARLAATHSKPAQRAHHS